MEDYKFKKFSSSKYLDIEVAELIESMEDRGWLLDRIVKDGVIFKRDVPEGYIPIWYIVSGQDKMGPFYNLKDAEVYGGQIEHMWIHPDSLKERVVMDDGEVIRFIEPKFKQTSGMRDRSWENVYGNYLGSLYNQYGSYAYSDPSSVQSLASNTQSLDRYILHGTVRHYNIQFNDNNPYYDITLDTGEHLRGPDLNQLLIEIERRQRYDQQRARNIENF